MSDMNSTSRLFVYGTLRDDPSHDMHRVLAQSAMFVGKGVVNASLYDLGEYPGIILSSRDGDRVAGEVYELTPPNAAAALRRLDDYEGLGPDDPEPHEYRRVLVQVQMDDGSATQAWAYVLSDDNPRHPRIPATDYVEWKKLLA